jgi:3-deoxy-D-manno-octulosonate 8-phosphate phosphatase (KDO 8-P phosphatase)
VNENEFSERLKTIRLVAMDVDGTYTDGQIYYDSAGEVIKGFHAHDGFALELLRMSGIRRGFITGRKDKATRARATYLGVDFILDSVGNKREAMESLQAQYDIPREACLFIGDDINDIPAFEASGLCVAVANATEEVKSRADFITVRSGGTGAVREVVEMIMVSKGIDTVQLWLSGKSIIAGRQ